MHELVLHFVPFHSVFFRTQPGMNKNKLVLRLYESASLLETLDKVGKSFRFRFQSFDLSGRKMN